MRDDSFYAHNQSYRQMNTSNMNYSDSGLDNSAFMNKSANNIAKSNTIVPNSNLYDEFDPIQEDNENSSSQYQHSVADSIRQQSNTSLSKKRSGGVDDEGDGESMDEFFNDKDYSQFNHLDFRDSKNKEIDTSTAPFEIRIKEIEKKEDTTIDLKRDSSHRSRNNIFDIPGLRNSLKSLIDINEGRSRNDYSFSKSNTNKSVSELFSVFTTRM